ncbi:hypothetical protein FOCC_FOCC011316, partial [Frankliniella occidentalis]
MSPIEVRLEPGGRQMVEALRALLVATHWHSFTLMADEAASTSVLLKADMAAVLRAPPLHPTFGRRLNMVDGHFVWLWLDTRAVHEDPPPPPPLPPPPGGLPPGAASAQDPADDWGPAGGGRRPRGVAAAAAAAAASPPAQQPSERRRNSDDGSTDWKTAGEKPSMRGQTKQWQHTPRGSQAPPPPVMRHRGPPRHSGAVDPPPFPLGMLTIRRQAMRLDRHAVKGGLRVVVEALRRLSVLPAPQQQQPLLPGAVPSQPGRADCWAPGARVLGPSRTPGPPRTFSALMT